MPCECDLRHRRWNLLSGECDSCGGSFPIPNKLSNASPVETTTQAGCSDAEIEHGLKLAAKATPAPWDSSGAEIDDLEPAFVFVPECIEMHPTNITMNVGGEYNGWDWLFVAHARNTWPALAREVQRLRSEAAAMSDKLAQAERERDELRAKAACGFCGWICDINDGEAFRKHVTSCDKHPAKMAADVNRHLCGELEVFHKWLDAAEVPDEDDRGNRLSATERLLHLAARAGIAAAAAPIPETR